MITGYLLGYNLYVWAGIPISALRWILILLLCRFGFLYALGIALDLFGRRAKPKAAHPWAETPYDGFALLATARRAAPKDFDVFISYRSRDVALARHVADTLIASGLRVWFAEYTILIAGRTRFEEAINDGIRRSQFGVVFSNDSYVKSPYCRLEVEQLLAAGNCGPDHILDVRLGDERETRRMYPQLSESPTVDFDGDIDHVLRAIERTTSWHVEPVTAGRRTAEPVITSHGDGTIFTLDAAGWRLVRSGGRPTLYGIEGPACTRTERGCETRWNLIVGPMIPGARPSAVKSDAMDERQFYDMMLQFAAQFIATVNARCAGVHLLHVGGFGQVALTYWFRHDDYWTRRYSIVLPHPKTGQSIEFAFTFGFFGPFGEYCRQANDMDRVVGSLTWK
jgi:hypothetical protein